jgi:hypothetical protein
MLQGLETGNTARYCRKASRLGKRGVGYQVAIKTNEAISMSIPQEMDLQVKSFGLGN